MVLRIPKTLFLVSCLAFKRPGAAAIDITSRCNLRCKHCYWWEQDHPRELDDNEMIGFFRNLRARSIRAAILYGGEPALRPNICKAATQIFDAVLIFTNGTLGLPWLKNGQWIVSLDGPKAINDHLRGKGVFEAAINSIRSASQPPIVHITISQLNAQHIEEFIREMVNLPIKGLGFSFYTPVKGSNHEGLFVPLDQRASIIEKILSLRNKYGEKVGFTRAMARQLLPTEDFLSWNRYEKCPVSRGVECYRADGTRKACTYGDNADCSRCGCAAVVVYRGALYPPNHETLRLVFGLVSSRFSPKEMRV